MLRGVSRHILRGEREQVHHANGTVELNTRLFLQAFSKLRPEFRSPRVKFCDAIRRGVSVSRPESVDAARVTGVKGGKSFGIIRHWHPVVALDV